MRRFHVVLLLLFGGATAVAQDAAELITDRPDRTESAYAVPSGSVQVEIGYLYQKNLGAPFESVKTPGMLLRFGMPGESEVRIEAQRELAREHPLVALEPVPAVATTTVSVGGKVVLLTESTSPVQLAAFLTGGVVMTADYFDEESELVGGRLAVSRAVSEFLEVSANAGAEYEFDSGTLTPFYTLSAGMDFTPEIGGFVELFGEFAGDSGVESMHAWNAGVTYLVHPNLQLDIAGGRRLAGSGPDYSGIFRRHHRL